MQDQSPRLIRMPEVIRLSGLGKSQIYALANRGDFPAGLKISERCSAWVESEVQAWVNARIAAARAPKAA